LHRLLNLNSRAKIKSENILINGIKTNSSNSTDEIKNRKLLAQKKALKIMKQKLLQRKKLIIEKLLKKKKQQ
jgi:hypothetical protein